MSPISSRDWELILSQGDYAGRPRWRAWAQGLTMLPPLLYSPVAERALFGQAVE